MSSYRRKSTSKRLKERFRTIKILILIVKYKGLSE